MDGEDLPVCGREVVKDFFPPLHMSIILKFPRNPHLRPYSKAASTAFTADAAVAGDTDGTSTGFIAATSTTQSISGIIQAAVASTDSDYATTGKKNLLVDEDGEWLCTATGTAAANDENGYFDFSDSVTINVAATTYQPFQASRFVSTTALIGFFTTWQPRINIVNAD